jgi:hypothetical protein
MRNPPYPAAQVPIMNSLSVRPMLSLDLEISILRRRRRSFQRDPEICGGETVLKGTRVTLRTVLASLADGSSFEQILADYPRIICARSWLSRQRPQMKIFRHRFCQLPVENQTRRLGTSASAHFQSSLSLSAHHSLNSFLVFACSMS